MDGLILIGVFTAITLLAVAAKPSQAVTSGLEDTPVSIDNIRRGVASGWYACTLIRVDGIPAVRLSGRTTAGKDYSDIFRISEKDWNTLKNEGYNVA